MNAERTPNDGTSRHIIKWTDGDNSWAMDIQPGKVSIKTTDNKIKPETMDSLSRSWTEAFNFINNSFERHRDA